MEPVFFLHIVFSLFPRWAFKSASYRQSCQLGGGGARAAPPPASSLLSVISVCHVAGDDQSTGEDLVRREEAVQMPKRCI